MSLYPHEPLSGEELQKAARSLKDAVRADFYNRWVDRGWELLGRSEYLKAIDAFLWALGEGAGRVVECYHGLGVCYERLERHKGALACYDRALNLVEEDEHRRAQILIDRADTVRLFSGREIEAKRDLDEAVRISVLCNDLAKLQSALHYLGRLDIQQNRHFTARCTLSHALSLARDGHNRENYLYTALDYAAVQHLCGVSREASKVARGCILRAARQSRRHLLRALLLSLPWKLKKKFRWIYYGRGNSEAEVANDSND
jgi:tetratricopeptide (TPR) repeat protein